jgi:hypothetical protein
MLKKRMKKELKIYYRKLYRQTKSVSMLLSQILTDIIAFSRKSFFLTILQRREGEASKKFGLRVLCKLRTSALFLDDSYHDHYKISQKNIIDKNNVNVQ